MKKLTEKQLEILDFIAEFGVREGMAPTVYEIADHFDIKTSTVFAHLRALQRKGKLTRTSQARSIKLTGFSHDRRHMRHTITIHLETANGETEEYQLDQQLFPEPNDYFALRMSDNTMHDFGIFTDDVLIIDVQQEPKPGDLVAAEVFGKTMLRCFYPKRGEKVELRPGNPELSGLIYSCDEVKIRGVATALYRAY